MKLYEYDDERMPITLHATVELEVGRKDFSLNAGYSTYLELADGTYLKVMVSEWGDVSIVDSLPIPKPPKPRDRIKPLGENDAESQEASSEEAGSEEASEEEGRERS